MASSRESGSGHTRSQPQGHTPTFSVPNQPLGVSSDQDMDRWQYAGESPQTATMEEFNFNSSMTLPMDNMNNMNNNSHWEMIGLGLEEPLPTQETIDEL